MPGVTITATNIGTGVALTNVSNEAGAYTLLSLIPGTYDVTAELPGFQKATYAKVELGNAVTVRLNFTLNVATQAQSVEVTIAADTVLATSSPTIGQVMTEKKVSELPVVGNNVLDMLSVLGGIDNLVATGANPQAGHAFGREGTTIAGVSAQDTPVLRDGIMVSDTRWPTGINTNYGHESGHGGRNSVNCIPGGCRVRTRKWCRPDHHAFWNEPVSRSCGMEYPEQCDECQYLDATTRPIRL